MRGFTGHLEIARSANYLWARRVQRLIFGSTSSYATTRSNTRINDGKDRIHTSPGLWRMSESKSLPETTAGSS